MAPRSPHPPNFVGAPARDARPVRSRLPWLHALPSLARPVSRTMPWITLITGCLTSVVYLAVMAHFAEVSRMPLDQGSVRLAFLPAIAALAFVPRTPFRALAQAAPIPTWVAPVGRLLLAAPLLAVTCWAQLRIFERTIPPHVFGHVPAAYPLVAQLTGWCAVTAAAATCVERSRYANLGGAVAAPASFALIAVAWYAPVASRFLAEPPASSHTVTIAWYSVASAALALSGFAVRDQWHRYLRSFHISAWKCPRSCSRDL